ncbi:MAG: peptide MFS transporter [Gammaproteobacteria bacterium]
MQLIKEPSVANPAPATIKQPRGLYILFFTELWERYGFYTIQALLVLFLTEHFLLSDKKAYGIFGAYGAMIYATPVIGGYIADKILGFRRAIYFGGFLFICGYSLLALLDRGIWFYFALSCLICGNGFFKSNVSSLLGRFYSENDVRRDAGFTLFYMGINIGSFLATLLGAGMAARYGWNVAFGIAAIGMVIGMIVFTLGQKQIGQIGDPPKLATLKKKRLGVLNEIWVFVGTIIIIGTLSCLLQFPDIVRWGLLFFGIATIFYVLTTSIQLDGYQHRRVIALLILILFSVIFWSLYYQTFSSITLFIDRVVNRHVFGVTIPTAMFQSISPTIIILLSPILSWVWLTLAKRGIGLSAPMKFALGILQMAIGFLILTLAVYFDSDAGKIAAAWMLLIFFSQTMGELFLSPIGLSTVTTLAPAKSTGLMMGVWFLSLGAANAIAGWIADFTAIPDSMTNPILIEHHYAHAYKMFGLWGVTFAVLLMLLTPMLKRMMGMVR